MSTLRLPPEPRRQAWLLHATTSRNNKMSTQKADTHVEVIAVNSKVGPAII